MDESFAGELKAFDEWKKEDLGFALEGLEELAMWEAIEHVAEHVRVNGQKVVQQRAGMEYEDSVSGWTNYSPWEFTSDGDGVWESSWTEEEHE